MSHTVIRLRAAEVDLDTLQVRRDDGQVLGLTKSEAALVRYLSERPGTVIGKDELLQEVWGYAPGVRSRAVDTAVGRLRPKLEADPSEPDHLITVFGSGYRFDVAELEVPGLFGRVDDMRTLIEGTRDHAMVTLVGPGGVGKSSLAHAWLERHPDASWVDLVGVETQTAFIGAILETLGGKLHDADPIRGALGLVGGRTLVLDNLDAVTGPAAKCLAVWLTEAPELRVLGTSRQALGLPDEHVLRLGPIAPDPSAELFRTRAASIDPSLALPDALVDRILGDLDGVPLAIELAAGRLHVLSPEALARRTADFAHCDLDASVQRSWDLLDERERTVLAQLALFRAGFDASAAEAVTGREDTLDALEVLRQRSLLRANRGELRLYPAVQHFASRVDPGQEAVLRWARFLADRTEGRWSKDQSAAIDRLLDDAPGLAMRLAVPRVDRHMQLGENQAALALGERLRPHLDRGSPTDRAHGWSALAIGLQCCGRYQDAVEAGQRAREVDPDGPLVAASWLREARLHMSYGQLESMAAAVAEAEVRATDPVLQLRVALTQANLERMRGDTHAALEVFEGAMGRNRGAPVSIDLALLELNYGTTLLESGRPDLALPMLARAADHLAVLDRPALEALVDGNRAECLRSQGRFDEARPLFLSALQAVREGRSLPSMEAILLIQLSAMEQEAGALDHAAELANDALLAAGPQVRWRAVALVQVGGVHHERGWTLLAREAYTRGLEQLEQIGDSRLISLVEARLAALEAPEDVDEAQRWLDRAVGHAQDDPQLALTHALYAAMVSLHRGEDVDEVLAQATRPVPDEPAPHPSAWNPEVRFAAKMLRRARDARRAG